MDSHWRWTLNSTQCLINSFNLLTEARQVSGHPLKPFSQRFRFHHTATLRGRPRRLGDKEACKDMGSHLTTNLASQTAMSSLRHNRRLLPGRRQIGGRVDGLREASLRMLAGDLCKSTANWSTDTSSNIELPLTCSVIQRTFAVICKKTSISCQKNAELFNQRESRQNNAIYVIYTRSDDSSTRYARNSEISPLGRARSRTQRKNDFSITGCISTERSLHVPRRGDRANCGQMAKPVLAAAIPIHGHGVRSNALGRAKIQKVADKRRRLNSQARRKAR